MDIVQFVRYSSCYKSKRKEEYKRIWEFYREAAQEQKEKDALQTKSIYDFFISHVTVEFELNRFNQITIKKLHETAFANMDSYKEAYSVYPMLVSLLETTI